MKIKNIQIDIVQTDILSLQADSKVLDCKNPDETAVRETVAAALRQAQKNGQRSICFTDLGCKEEEIPHAAVARIMVQEFMNYARAHDNPSLNRIVLCIENGATFGVFNKTARAYLRHMQDDLGLGPFVTVDIIIELADGIILIERSNPPFGWALPGGFLDYGESLEQAAVREAKEETNLDLINLRQFHTYSMPGRDPRFQTISTVFVAEGKGKPKSGDDAKDLKIVRYEALLEVDYAFDHKDIIKEYLIERSFD